MICEKRTNEICDFIDFFVKREMIGFKDMHLGFGYIALISGGTSNRKRRRVLAPEYEPWVACVRASKPAMPDTRPRSFGSHTAMLILPRFDSLTDERNTEF